ncbi:MAG: Ig-like domain-containing protein, partial [Bacteroidota bacterium]
MNRIWFSTLLLILLMLSSCIGDDLVFDLISESVRISNPLDSLAVGDTYQLEATYLDRLGQEQGAEIIWTSSDESLLQIDETGLATGIAAGEVLVKASVTLEADQVVTDSLPIVVGNRTSSKVERIGTIQTTSSYVLEGDFVLEEGENGLTLSIANNYRASSSLPGLYLYLTNNPNTINNALEISKVTTFEGAHSYEIPASV